MKIKDTYKGWELVYHSGGVNAINGNQQLAPSFDPRTFKATGYWLRINNEPVKKYNYKKIQTVIDKLSNRN
jgi:hypothetical protein